MAVVLCEEDEEGKFVKICLEKMKMLCLSLFPATGVFAGGSSLITV